MSDRISKADDHLTVLVEVVRQMSETFELVPLLQTAERAGRSALGCDRATIFLYDHGSDELYSKVATGTGEIRFSAKLGIAGEVAQTRSVIIVPDAYADKRFNPEIDRKTGYRTCNMLTLPLVTPDDEVIGVLQLLNKLEGVFDAGDKMLAGALGSLIGMAIKRQMLLDAAAERDRMEHDLDIARDIQMQMLPKENPTVPGFDVAGWNRPADQTGGDCFGFLPLEGHRLVFLIADASGHGIGPALVVTQCRAMIRAMADRHEDLSLMAGKVNNLLCEDLSAGRFVTACFGILDADVHQAHYVSGGHGPLLLFRAGCDEVESFGATGLPLGIMAGAEFQEGPPIHFQPGDMFLIPTDGFTEWARPDGELYGQDRLSRVILRHRSRPCAEIIQAVYADVLKFSEGTLQADDLTAVLIKRTV